MDFHFILSLIGTLGGFEAIRWGITYFMNRKSEGRKSEASAEAMEMDNNQRQINWLETRLSQRDAKIDVLYTELRNEQTRCLEWIHKCHEAELQLKELNIRRCDVRKCANRKPPGDF